MNEAVDDGGSKSKLDRSHHRTVITNKPQLHAISRNCKRFHIDCRASPILTRARSVPTTAPAHPHP